MTVELSVYTLLYLIIIIIESIFMLLFFKEHDKRGAVPLGFIFMLLTLHTLFQLLEGAAQSYLFSSVWDRGNYLTIAWLPVVLVHFADRYFNLRLERRSVIYILFTGMSLLLSILVLTTFHHSLFVFDLVETDGDILAVTRYSSGVFLYIFYAYVLTGSLVYIYYAFSMAVKEQHIYRKRGFLLIWAVVVPLVFALFYILYESRINFYYLPFAFFAGMCFTIYLYLRGELFGPVPVESLYLLQTLIDGVIIFDSNGVVLDYNRRAQEYIPCLSEDYIGLTVQEILEKNGELAFLSFPSEEESEWDTTIISPCTADVSRVMELRYQKVMKSGITTLVIRDVSEQRGIEERLEVSSRLLEEDSRVKGVLIEVLSHDLKSPLMLMRSMVHAGSASSLGGEGAAELDDLIDRSDSLIGNIAALEDTVDLRREYPFDTVSLVDIYGTFSGHFMRYAASKDVRLTVSFDEGAALYVNADLCARVLYNVIENAVKYSPSGTEVKVMQQVSDEKVSIIVEDEGFGIDDDALAAFVKGKWGITKMGTAGESGPGIALYASKKFLEWMGGEMMVERKEGVGTRVSVIVRRAFPRMKGE